MSKLFSAVLFGALVLGVGACSKIKTLTGVGQDLNKVGELWSDVPRMEGLASSEADMPIYVKLLMRTALNNLGRLSNANEDRTHSTGDWAVFTTAKQPDDVRSFYNNDRMTSFGSWEASKNSTCMNGNEYGFAGVGCVFKKNANNRGIGLLIVAAQDEKKTQTTIFFVRVETDETPAADKNANTTMSPPAKKNQSNR